METSTISLNDLVVSARFQKLVWLLQRLEGFQAKVYPDIAGNLTIGYGHELMGGMLQDPGVRSLGLSLSQLQAGLSPENALQLLAHDIFHRANIQKAILITIPDPLWVSLSSFCFNVGFTSFLKSQAFQSLASGNIHDIVNSLASWRGVKSIFSPGIAKRRLCEILILMQKPLVIQSSASPSEQWQTPMPLTFLDDNWYRLSTSIKQEALDLYNLYQTTFPPLVSASLPPPSPFSSLKEKIKDFIAQWRRS